LQKNGNLPADFWQAVADELADRYAGAATGGAVRAEQMLLQTSAASSLEYLDELGETQSPKKLEEPSEDFAEELRAMPSFAGER
jgi:hypothetical protein